MSPKSLDDARAITPHFVDPRNMGAPPLCKQPLPFHAVHAQYPDRAACRRSSPSVTCMMPSRPRDRSYLQLLLLSPAACIYGQCMYAILREQARLPNLLSWARLTCMHPIRTTFHRVCVNLTCVTM